MDNPASPGMQYAIPSQVLQILSNHTLVLCILLAQNKVNLHVCWGLVWGDVDHCTDPFRSAISLRVKEGEKMSLKHLARGSQNPEMRSQDWDSSLQQGFGACTLNHCILLFLPENKDDWNILKEASPLRSEGQRPVWCEKDVSAEHTINV